MKFIFLKLIFRPVGL